MMESSYSQKQEIPIGYAPKRVVSLVPSVTESLYDLNLGHTLVGITDYCIFPKGQVDHITRIGGTKNPDVQHIIALQPELVIANQEENRREDVEALQAAGLAVWVTFPKSVSDVFNLLWNIMYLFDETVMVPRIRLIERTYDWVLGITKANEHNPVTVFAPIWLDPLMTFNQDTYAHDLLAVCGGTNIFAQRKRQFPLAADIGEGEPLTDDDSRVAGRDRRYPRVSLEEVAKLQPDVILLPSEPFAFTEEHIPLFGELDVPAAQNNRIHLVDGTLLTWHGTRVAYALNTFPSLFYPAVD